MTGEEFTALHFLKDYIRAVKELDYRMMQSDMTAERLQNLVLDITGDQDKADSAYANRVLAEEKQRWSNSQGKSYSKSR